MTNPNEFVPMTAMGSDMDRNAIVSCLNSGMIVIVEIDTTSGYKVSGIVSAHINVAQAYEAYKPVEDSEGFAVIIPSETGPRMFYNWLSLEEFKDAARG